MATEAVATHLKILFRGIMRMHREKLPGELRDIGDSYVKAEFRAHLKGNTTQAQWGQFLEQWNGYLAMLQPPADPSSRATASSLANEEQPKATGLPGGHAGAVDAVRQVSEGLDMYMSPEQKLRLEALRKEAGQVGQSMLGPAPTTNANQ